MLLHDHVGLLVSEFLMRRLIVLLVLAMSGCTYHRYVLEHHRQLGPHSSEDIWRDRKTGTCERRTIIADYESDVEVPCDDDTPKVPERRTS